MSVSLDLNKAFEQTMKFYKEQKVKIVQENNQFPYLKSKRQIIPRLANNRF